MGNRALTKFKNFLNENLPIEEIIRYHIEAFFTTQTKVSNKTILNYHVGLSSLPFSPRTGQAFWRYLTSSPGMHANDSWQLDFLLGYDWRSINMDENQLFQQGSRGCYISLLIILLAICAMIVSISYQYPAHPSCGGMLGAGFPTLFICDDWGGGSPSSSWGKITFVDVPNGGIRPAGFLLDFLFYTALIWIVVLGVFRKRIHHRTLWWGALISIGFMAGFLCAFLTFQSSSLYLGESYYQTTPTPIIPSPTSSATDDSSITPIAALISSSLPDQ